MIKKLNKKGFTLVELLAVLVILVAIMGIAIPSISSSLERTKESQNEAHYKIIESAAEQYVTDHKNAVYNLLGDESSCYMIISELSDYLTEEEMKSVDGDIDLRGYSVVFTKPITYEFIEDGTNGTATISCIN